MGKMSKGDAMDGMDTDGDSKNTFGPKPKSTPNKVGADGSLTKKNGKGNITGGIEEESIFGDINYTGNTANAAKSDFNSIDKSIFNTDTTFDSRGFAANKDGGVFGSGGYAAGSKNTKDSGEIDGKKKAKYVGKVTNVKKKNITSSTSGKNPTSQNVKLSKNILSK